MNYYIADTHFGHFNVIRFDNRPFSSIDEMDTTLIKNWNKTVTEKDTVYILGDFSWYREDKTLEILDNLKGKKILIKGNHDRISPAIARKFINKCEYLEVKDNENRVILSHYPMPFWNGQFRDTIHLYGHVHNTLQYEYCEKIKKEIRNEQGLSMRMFNVGVMMPYMDYSPQSLEHILRYSPR